MVKATFECFCVVFSTENGEETKMIQKAFVCFTEENGGTKWVFVVFLLLF